MKIPLLGKTVAELQHLAMESGLPKFTGNQVADWLYSKRVDSILQMTNLSKNARARLSELYETGKHPPLDVKVSSDGTKKYLFETAPHQYVETAMIPEQDRITVCVSSQAGCKMGCLFCMTGKQGFQGQLSAGEIINQILSIEESSLITNVVFMGMGEPFDNTQEVLKSLEIMTSPWGLGLSPRRITVSTIGIIPGMQQFLRESESHLAISLHSPFDNERKVLIPAQKAYPAALVIEEIKKYDFSHQRRVSFEYIMFRNINDTSRHVNGLSQLLGNLNCRINLIRFHAIPETALKGSDEETIMAFKDMLNQKGILTTVRTSRGLDINAACGLLSTKELLKSPKEE